MDIWIRLKEAIIVLFRSHPARNAGLFSFRKLIFLPSILSSKEKRFLVLIFLIALVSGIAFFVRVYVRITVPVSTVGGSYTEGILGQPRSINPLFATRDADRDISRLVYAGLVTYDGQGHIKLDLAESYEVSPDRRVYTVTLKKQAQWHDEVPVSADDVVFTISLVQNPLFHSALRANWQGVGVEKINDQTLRFTLRVPYAPFLENLTLGILPKHIWAGVKPEQILLHEANLRPIGSGPYRFFDMKQNKDGSLSWYELTRHTAYHREGPYIKDITFFFFKTEDDLFGAWRRGIIEGFGPVSPARLPEINQDTAHVQSLATPRLFGLFFNAREQPALDDVRVRKAIAMAIDKKRILAAQHLARALPADYALPSLQSQGDPDISTYNPSMSRALLKEAGWIDKDANGILDKKKREKGKTVFIPLSLTLTTSDWPDLTATADLIASMLKEVGIEVTVQKYPVAELETKIIRPRKYEMLLFGQVYGYEEDSFPFWHSSQIKDPGLNITYYANKKADQLMVELRETSDPAERDSRLRNLASQIDTDMPAVFLFTQLYLYLTPSDIKGDTLSVISLPADRFNGINEWYRRVGRKLK